MARKKTTTPPQPMPIASEEASSTGYVVLARKYRPQRFEDLIGQEAMVETLRNAFATGRIAQGYMLTGVRGVGKTTTARILARALNYEPTDGASGANETGPTVDLTEMGRHCAQIMQSRHTDVIEMDAASNTGVDNIREIIESARYKPLVARYKVFIIDEVHMLSKGAFNALLKTLEEPPEHVKFIFATTEIRKVPVTVLSRCQRFDLRRVDVPMLTAHLTNIVSEEKASAEDEALALIARAAEGSVRDGLSILDQAIAFAKGKIKTDDVRAMLGLADSGRVFDLLDHVFSGNAGGAVEALAALVRDGAEPRQVLVDLSECVHIATRHKAVGAEVVGDGLSAEQKRRAGEIADALSVPYLGRAWQILVKGISEVDQAPNPLIAAEMVLIRLAYTADLPTPDAVIKMLGDGGVVQGGGAKKAPSSADTVVAKKDDPVLRQKSGNDQASSEHENQPGRAVSRNVDARAPSLGIETSRINSSATVALPTFEALVDFVGQQRDAKLKVNLEEFVSIIRYDGEACAIDMCLLPDAPSQLANELREKLNKWTDRRWVVVLSAEPGAMTLGEARRQREAALRQSVSQHPAVKAVYEAFPDAEVSEIRPLEIDNGKDDSQAG